MIDLYLTSVSCTPSSALYCHTRQISLWGTGEADLGGGGGGGGKLGYCPAIFRVCFTEQF